MSTLYCLKTREIYGNHDASVNDYGPPSDGMKSASRSKKKKNKNNICII